MIKKLTSVALTGLLIVGVVNVVTLNKPVFEHIGKTLTKKPAAEIPGGIVSDVFDHQWKFIASK